MQEFGKYIKSLRISKGLSLKELAKNIGTTDTILSRLENGHLPKDIVTIFDSLANFYGMNVITLYIQSGIISKNDLNEYNGVFEHCNKLNEEEIKHIQKEIDFIISLKKR